MSLELKKQHETLAPGRPWLHPLGSVLAAGLLFLLTIWSLGWLSCVWTENVALPPGAVQAMGVNPTPDTFQGVFLQRLAFETPGVFPLYGSSEMSMIVDYHPAKVFTPERGVTPFLVGKGGTQTLIQAMELASLGDVVHGKKLAVFITPQWYGPGGISQATFAGNFSALQAYEILKNPTLSGTVKQAFAQRLLNFPEAFRDFPLLKKAVVAQAQSDQDVNEGKARDWLPTQMEYTSLVLQDVAKTKWHVKSLPPKTVEHYAQTASSLQPIPWEQLREQAIAQGKQETGDNPFGMDQAFYQEHIEPKLSERKDSDKTASLSTSTEYDDLQLLMKVLKEEGAKPLFVIIPMNGRWSDYTGFPQSERQRCYHRLNQMVKSEGFPVADFSGHEQDAYYLRDPWHFAWRGWVDVNEALYRFYSNSQ